MGIERVITGNELDSHYLSIGRFVVTYSHVEATIRDVLAQFSGLSHNTAPVLIGDMRMGQMTTALAQVLGSMRPHPRADSDLREIMAELDKLASLRNKVVHRQWASGDEGVVFHNLGTAKTPAKFDMTAMTSLEIDAATAKLVNLHERLSRHLVHQETWERIPEAYRPIGSFPWFENPA